MFVFKIDTFSIAVFTVCLTILSLPAFITGNPNTYNNNNDNWAGGRDIVSGTWDITGGSSEDSNNNNGYGPTSSFPESIACTNLRPQHSLDILEVMGIWYGSEILMHTSEMGSVYSYNYNSCVIIHIGDVTEEIQQRLSRQRSYNNNDNNNNNNNNNRRVSSPYPTHNTETNTFLNHPDQTVAVRYLRLVWTEKDKNTEYTLNYTLSSPGIWVNMGDQRGSLTYIDQYKQFRGTVQVVKAVNDHLVLTFCGTDITSSIFSIVLSRHRRGLNYDELGSIRSLLNRRGLHTGSIRKVCANGGAAIAVTTATTTMLLFILSKMLGWMT